MSIQRSVRSARRAPAAAVMLLTAAGLLLLPSAAQAVQPGDAQRFGTWTGYDAGRYPVAVVAGDLNGDGLADAAWARNDFFENRMGVQLNLGDGTLSEVVEYPVQAQSVDIAFGDLDGDGDPDLVVASQGNDLAGNTVDLYTNDGSGVFEHSTATGGNGPGKLALADFNGDARPDIALTNYWSFPDGSMSVMLNQGNGTFGPETVYPMGWRPNGIVAADLDGDLDNDLAVARRDEATNDVAITLFLNSGLGLFVEAPTTPTIDEQISDPVVTAADFDGDTDADLAVAGIGSASHYLLMNQGLLSFSERRFTAGFSSNNLHAVDDDGDQDVDLLSATFGSSSTGDVSLLLNDGSGILGPAQPIESSHQPYDVATADFDGNGELDLAVPNRGSSTAAVHPKRPDGTLAEPPTYQTPAPPAQVATGDFDGDGDTDVASALPDQFGPNDSVQIQLNDGAGNLSNGHRLAPGGDRPQFVVASELNGDDRPDLVWGLGSQPYPFVTALNNGDGTFADPVAHPLDGCQTAQVTTADADNDGDQDVLVAINSLSDSCLNVLDSVAVVPNQGDGTFGVHAYVEMAPFVDMAVGADLNGDQLTDLASVQSGFAREDDFAVALGTGGGSFAPAVTYTTGVGHRELAVSDLDGDGDLDVAMADYDDAVTVGLNAGDGTFPSFDTYRGETISGLGNQYALAVGDLNGDAADDLVVANYSGNDIGVHYGHGDGGFDPHQLRYGTHTAPRDVQLADMDGDGRSDVVVPNYQEGQVATATVKARGVRQAAPERDAAAEAASARGVSVLLNVGPVTPLRCTVSGTPADDVLRGTPQDDVLCGFQGKDRLVGLGGVDILIGEDGRDALQGGPGRDVLIGGTGNDGLDARDGSGGDRVLGGDGADRCLSDAGDLTRSCP